MAILMRQGLYDDFDASKMLPGEWAVAVDSDTTKQVVWMCFAPGITKRMGTYEDFVRQIKDATGEIKEEYIAEFDAILTQIEMLASQTNENTSTVLQFKTDFMDTYLPQIQQAVLNSEAAAKTATQKASDSEEYALIAQSYAVGTGGARENETVDNAKYYYEQAKRISGGLSGALTPMGTIMFADLQNMTKQAGYMYNISDAFITDETFNEGAGFSYPEGTNVYYTADGYWDCLAGTVTPEGIGALAVDGDSASNTVTFISGDAADSDENPLAWVDVDPLKSGEKHSSVFAKISTMFRNVRYLFKMIGTTDISALGDGTITGTLNTLNTDLSSMKRHTESNTFLINGVAWENTTASFVNGEATTTLKKTPLSTYHLQVTVTIGATGYVIKDAMITDIANKTLRVRLNDALTGTVRICVTYPYQE